MARIRVLVVAAIIASVLDGSGLSGQRPTTKPDTATPLVFGTIRDREPLQWGPEPSGRAHSPRVRAYDLQHQIVHVAFDWPRHAVSGSTTIRVAALGRPLDRVELDAVGMSIKSIVNGAGERLLYDYDGRVLAIRLPIALQVGDTTSATIQYETVRPKTGVFFVEPRHVVWTQGRMEDNRYWVPTFDSPNDKTSWDLYVTTAGNERAFGVGSLVGQRLVDGGIEWHWTQRAPAPTYFMTIAVGPYEAIEDSAGPVRLTYWAYKDALQSARAGFSSTPGILEFLARKLGTRFPSSNFDQVVVPDFVFWDGLEGWRPIIATTVQDERLILGGRIGWPGEMAEASVARALAQEWFGKFVTPADWSHIWLSDGIANFLALVYEQEGAKPDSGRTFEWTQVSTFAADRDARRPLVYDHWQYGPIELLLTEHVTQKAPAVLRLLRSQLGDSAFWLGMRRFLADHANGVVTTADFERAMEQASSRDLTQFFRQWVYGAGFPMLQISFKYNTSTRRITVTAEQDQKRDALTGFFDAPAEVEVLTDAGPIRATMAMHGERSTLEMPLPSAPRAIRWDPEKLLPSDVTFTRPSEMLIYQAEHARDVAGREEAVQQLGRRATGLEGDYMIAIPAGNTAPLSHQELVPPLIRAARTDRSAHVRASAAESLGPLHLFDHALTDTLLALTYDREAEVRVAAAMALMGPGEPAVDARLAQMFESDPDSSVREFVSQLRGSLQPFDVYTRAKKQLEDPRTPEDEKANLVMTVANPSVPGGWNIAKQYLTNPTSSREVVEAAMHALGIALFMSEAQPGPTPEDVLKLLVPFLESDDPSIRLAAAREIGEVKLPAAKTALEARKRVEVDARVLRELDKSIAAVQRRRQPR